MEDDSRLTKMSSANMKLAPDILQMFPLDAKNRQKYPIKTVIRGHVSISLSLSSFDLLPVIQAYHGTGLYRFAIL